MDVEILSRLQFALTIMFHYIFPPLSIGLSVVLVTVETIYFKTGSSLYEKMARFWTKIFALTFAVGVATGIVMEFEFGTNWAAYSRYVGDVFGSALAAEGVFAFFLESGFLAVLLFGWHRVSRGLHLFSTWMVALGAHFSAVWIIIANSWMQTPAGYHIVGEGVHARAEITSFWDMVFNPSSMARIGHTVVGAWLAGAFLVISVAAYYLLKKCHRDFSYISLKIGGTIAAVSLVLQLFLGDLSGRIVASYQPAKLAAIEGLYHSQREAPLTIFGIVNPEAEQVDYALRIPGLLSWLCFRNVDAQVQGLEAFPKKDWPRTDILFYLYRLMLGMWGAMIFSVIILAYYVHRRTIEKKLWVVRFLVLSVFFPQLANQAGWVVAEMGRHPWLVYGHLRIAEGLSKTVHADQVLFSLILFSVIYLILGALFFYLLNNKIQKGPEDISLPMPGYHHLETAIKELLHGR